MNGREWTTEDLTEIAKLEEECFSDPWSQRMLADSFLSDGFFGSLLEEGNTITAYGGMRTVGEEAEIELIEQYSFRVNAFLKAYFLKLGVKLIDFKLEFGKLPDGTIVLADEISPDTCRFWDVNTNEKLDKDRFRRDMGGVEDAYREIFKRVTEGK